MQLRDSYFDEGISKCQGFSTNRRKGEKEHERNAKSFSIRVVGEENVWCSFSSSSWIFFKRSSGGNNNATSPCFYPAQSGGLRVMRREFDLRKCFCSDKMLEKETGRAGNGKSSEEGGRESVGSSEQ